MALIRSFQQKSAHCSLFLQLIFQSLHIVLELKSVMVEFAVLGGITTVELFSNILWL
jgi:hypothetical protein